MPQPLENKTTIELLELLDSDQVDYTVGEIVDELFVRVIPQDDELVVMRGGIRPNHSPI